MMHSARTSLFAHRPRLWRLVVALLLALQVGLLVHQSQHHLKPAIPASDDCALCQLASGMAAPPFVPAVVLPVFILLATVVLFAAAPLRDSRRTAPFRSRAPPARRSF